jgi:hypothetical protein
MVCYSNLHYVLIHNNVLFFSGPLMTDVSLKSMAVLLAGVG